MISRRALLSALPLAAACRRKPGSGYPGYAFVALADEPSIAVVDLLAFATRKRIALAAPPTTVLSYRGRVLAPVGAGLAEIHPQQHTLLRQARLPAAPSSLVAGHRRLWLISSSRAELVPFDLESFQAARPIPLAARPVSLDVAVRSPLAAVALERGAVQLVDLDAGRARPPIPLDSPASSVLFRTDSKLVAASQPDVHRLTFLEVVSGRVVTQLPLALRPERLCLKPDGGQLFITGEGRDAVVIVYPYRTEVAQTSLTGRKPGQMACSIDPDFLFVANPEAGSVTVFDINTQKVVAVTGVGMEPGAICVTPDQQYALVLNQASGDMAVIRIAAITPGRAKSAPLFTMVPVGARPMAAAVV